MRTKTCSILCSAFLAACGGDDGRSADPDADVATADSALVDAEVEPDGTPACLPGATVLAPGGVIVPGYFEDAQVTSTGDVNVLFFDGVNGKAVMEWDGAAWSAHSAYTGTNGGYGGLAFTEVAGEPVLLATPSDQTSDSDKLRFWLQLPSGTFATGQRIEAGASALETRRARYDTATGVLSVAVDNQQNYVTNNERNAAGTWSSQVVASFGGTATFAYGVGVGKLSDNTAAMGVTSTLGFDLYRRNGASWSLLHSLAAGGIYDANLSFPPEGTGGANAVALYVDPLVPHHLRGELVNTTTGVPTGAGDLSTLSGLTAVQSQIVFDDTGNSGKILVVDEQFSQPHAWVVSFSGTSFLAAQELRPDLVFDAYPRLLYHPCGGFIIVHVSRPSADAAGSASVIVEPLATFAPGL